MQFDELVKWAADTLEATGVAVIALGALLAAAITVWTGLRNGDLATRYQQVRQRVGRAILLGLEILVGGDIIRTVADRPTLQSVAVLGGIVLIRTFLSFTLEVELHRRWPWQENARGR
jgi:uncharacterized membrane protein